MKHFKQYFKHFMLMMAIMLFAVGTASAVDSVAMQHESASVTEAAITQTATVTDSSFVIDLGTFTGIVALISALVTQLFKVIPSIKQNKLTKILLSVASGIVICFIAWALHISPLLTDFEWWAALIYGIAAGLSGCGFYDIVKAIGELFKKEKATA